MLRKKRIISFLCISSLIGLISCESMPNEVNNNQGIPIRFLAGSDLKQFCEVSAEKLNATKPQLSSGERYYLVCDIKGSGDVFQEVVSLSQQLANGSTSPDDERFPSLISFDGPIYQNQLIYEIDKIFPGQNYIPPITDSPLLVYSPMVFMTTTELAPALAKAPNLYTVLQQYDNYQQLDSSALPLPIHFVQTAPTRSNSGLQTLVAQFASVANKPPEDLTIADIEAHQEEVREIQQKVTRYGISTGSLAQSMVENGVFWASVGSVYESLVIAANSQGDNSQKYQAVYPQSTFSSDIRSILPNAPWVTPQEKEASEAIIEFMRQPEIQAIAVSLGLRPGVPGVPLGNKFSAEFGVNPNPTYESYRPPQPEVVEVMLESWQNYAKKPSLVAVVVDISGSMQGTKFSSVQNTLLSYINNLGSKEEIVIIPFNSEIGQPLRVSSSPEDKFRAINYISSLQAGGGTRLYDSALFARNWLRENLKDEAINAVLILTDGEDSGSQVNLSQLEQELQKSGFNSDERIAFFTIGYGNEGEFSPDILQEIAQINGGYYRKGDPETIAQVMENLQVEF
ncbi:VWA domain-containing protein [Cyanobacterium stanieri LEGE 03274]|uniref:VWA domain-containing protein n=2 Tax=Cyanobacterium TaxID=102234 RepID=A0ABR9V1P8_9CHRO|nr:VWA domain-containing protein [Cyanobacterium stanieri LEGE 03274]